MTRTLVVWCPDWPITSAGIDGGSVPAAVLVANRVVACSAAARFEGVRRGLRRREAQARCPELVIVDDDPLLQARVFEPVVASIEAICPRVEIVRPGMCAFATRGPSRYFGGDEAVAKLVVSTVRSECNIACEVGIADGPFAAALAARAGTIVPPGESPAFLSPFPIRALDRPELADLLRRLGIRTLGAFAALPSDSVVERFGPDGALAHRLASGLDERPIATRTQQRDYVETAELDPPAERVDTAAFVAKSLADRLHDVLRHEGLACTRISIEAETEHGEHLARLWRHDGALTASAIAERVRWQLDGWLNGTAAERPTSGITLLRLVPDEVRPDTGAQAGFWGGTSEADARAARALARIQGLLGPDGVGTAVIDGGRSYAEQTMFVPWGDAREPAHAPTDPWPGQVPPPAPAIVHIESIAAEVVDRDGEPIVVTGRGLISGDPARLSIDGAQWTDVVAWAGPWPVDERWWDPPAHRRRARLQLLTAAGSAHLVAIEGHKWSVEATYD